VQSELFMVILEVWHPLLRVSANKETLNIYCWNVSILSKGKFKIFNDLKGSGVQPLNYRRHGKVLVMAPPTPIIYASVSSWCALISTIIIKFQDFLYLQIV